MSQSALDAHEYCGQLRTNTLALLGSVDPALKAGLNQDPGQAPLVIHHTVPYADPGAQEARDILAKWGISIHDPADAAIVPADYHRGENVHGMADGAYNTLINFEMRNADAEAEEASLTGGRAAGRAVILNALRKASDTLVAGSGNARAIGLEQTLRVLERPLPRPDLSDIYNWRGCVQ